MKAGGGRLPLLGALLAAAVAAGTFTARSPSALHALARITDVAQAGSGGAWLAFALVQVGVAAFGILPASLLAVAAGAAYGLWAGFLLSAAGTMGGGWIAFGLSRSVLRPWIMRVFARRRGFRAFDEAVAADGWRFVCLMRVSPVMPFAATSYGLGLTGIGQRDFLLGTLASLPALFGYVAVGAFGQAGLAFGRSDVGWLHVALPLAGVAAILWAVARTQRLVRRRLGAPARAG